MSLLGALSIASQGLMSNQIALKSTTKNLDNAYTDGYSREEAVFADLPNGGVEIAELRRVWSSALFKQVVRANYEASGYSQEETILSQIEAVFNDAQGGGFSDEINNFFNSMNDVALNPDDTAARENFLSAAQSLVGRIRQAYSFLEEIKNSYTSKLTEQVSQLNQLLNQLAELNGNISTTPKDSSSYNQLLDRRDELIKEISSQIEVKLTFNDDGSVNLYTAKGFALVLKERAFNLSTEVSDEGVEVKVQGVDLSRELSGGEIGGTLRGLAAVEEYEGRLNQFTSTFAELVNRQHEAGYDLYGETGVALFGSENGQPIDASNITLAITDPKKVAAASSPDYLNSDNGNIKALMELGEEKIDELGGLSFSEYYATQITGAIGAELSKVKNLSENASFQLESLEEKVSSISGVNVDEELVKLTQYQRAYQAAARVITVSDELIQTILNLVG